MNMEIIKILLKSNLRDTVSLIWAVALPLLIIIVSYFYLTDKQYEERFLLGVSTISILSYALMGTSFDVFLQRSSGVYKMIKISELGVGRYMFNYALSRSIVTFTLSLLVWVLGTLLFELELTMLILIQFVIFSVLCTFFSVFLGVFFANIGENPGQIATVSNIFLILLIGLSGVFYSIEILPNFLKIIASWMPIHIISQIANGNPSFLLYLFLSIILTIAAFALSVFTFKWTP